MPFLKKKKSDQPPVADQAAQSEMSEEKELNAVYEEDDTGNCQLCDKSFSLTVRRQYCRKCGHFTCGKCSNNYHDIRISEIKEIKKKSEWTGRRASTKPVSQDPDALKRVRCCDECHQEFAAEVPRHNTTQSIVDKMVDRRLQSWLYLFKPMHSAGDKVGIGELYIKVIGARNLPSMDLFTSDPYIIIKLGSQQVKTKTITKTLTPTWGSEFVLDVVNCLSTVHVTIWDSDIGSKDDQIGWFDVDLIDLSHQEPERKWYTIALSPGAEISHDRTPQVQLEMHFTYSRVGEFCSYFYGPDPNIADPYDEEFELDKLYREILRIVAALQPVIDFFPWLTAVLMWDNPITSSFWLFICVHVRVNTWIYPMLMQILLLKHMSVTYVVKQWQGGPRIYKEEIEEASHDTTVAHEKEEEVDVGEAKASMSGVLTTVASAALGSDWKVWAHWLQNLCKWITDLIEWLVGWFEWEHYGTSYFFYVLLIGTTIYSYFYTFMDVLTIILVYLMVMNTTPGLIVFNLLMGLIGYANRHRPAKPKVKIEVKSQSKREAIKQAAIEEEEENEVAGAAEISRSKKVKQSKSNGTSPTKSNGVAK